MDGKKPKAKIALGQLWRDKETDAHRAMGLEPQTARVVEFVGTKVRMEKVSGCGKARFRTMSRAGLLARHELVSS